MKKTFDGAKKKTWERHLMWHMGDDI